jgi:Domain of unknown function (DUF4203)
VDETAVTATQTATQTATTGLEHFFTSPTHLPAQADLLTWAQQMSPGVATILIIGGGVYLMFGYYIFKWLVMVNAGLFGAAIGYKIAEQTNGSLVIGAVAGGVIAAAIAWPLMKWAVAIMGGVFGALLGASLWRTSGLQPNLAWAGALSGLVGCGLLSFVLFRMSVIMYTSLQGSVMLIFGILGLVYKYKTVAPDVQQHLLVKPFLLPLAILIPAILGLVYQHMQHPAPAKKPA